MLEKDHQDFLGKYFKADTHYSFHEAPLQFLLNSETHDKNILDRAINSKDKVVVVAALDSPYATKDHLISGLTSGNYEKYETAISNPNYKKYFPNGHQ